MAYIGFKKLQQHIQSRGVGAKRAKAIAASIGRKKYGAKRFAKMSAASRSKKGRRRKVAT